MKIAILSGNSIESYESDQVCLKKTVLPHPNNRGESVYFVDLKNHLFFELVKQTDSHRSWFIDNSVVEDGSFTLITQFDPIYFIVSQLKKKSNSFQTIYDLLYDGKYFDNEIIHCISNALSKDQLSIVADIKDIDNEIYIKFNQEKTLNWLKCRIQNIVDVLKQDSSLTSSGSKIIGFTTGREQKQDNKEIYYKYAFDILSEYLDENISNDLRVSLRIPIENNEQRNKRKFENVETVKSRGSFTEENKFMKSSTDLIEKTSNEIKEKQVKMTRSQKTLLKVDKSGMKSISSYFKPKT